MIRLSRPASQVLNAAEFARNRAIRLLEHSEDVRSFSFDIRSCGENLILLADILDGKVTVEDRDG